MPIAAPITLSSCPGSTPTASRTSAKASARTPAVSDHRRMCSSSCSASCSAAARRVLSHSRPSRRSMTGQNAPSGNGSRPAALNVVVTRGSSRTTFPEKNARALSMESAPWTTPSQIKMGSPTVPRNLNSPTRFSTGPGSIRSESSRSSTWTLKVSTRVRAVVVSERITDPETDAPSRSRRTGLRLTERSAFAWSGTTWRGEGSIPETWEKGGRVLLFSAIVLRDGASDGMNAASSTPSRRAAQPAGKTADRSLSSIRRSRTGHTRGRTGR